MTIYYTNVSYLSQVNSAEHWLPAECMTYRVGGPAEPAISTNSEGKRQKPSYLARTTPTKEAELTYLAEQRVQALESEVNSHPSCAINSYVKSRHL